MSQCPQILTGDSIISIDDIRLGKPLITTYTFLIRRYRFHGFKGKPLGCINHPQVIINFIYHQRYIKITHKVRKQAAGSILIKLKHTFTQLAGLS